MSTASSTVPPTVTPTVAPSNSSAAAPSRSPVPQQLPRPAGSAPPYVVGLPSIRPVVVSSKPAASAATTAVTKDGAVHVVSHLDGRPVWGIDGCHHPPTDSGGFSLICTRCLPRKRAAAGLPADDEKSVPMDTSPGETKTPAVVTKPQLGAKHRHRSDDEESWSWISSAASSLFHHLAGRGGPEARGWDAMRNINRDFIREYMRPAPGHHMPGGGRPARRSINFDTGGSNAAQGLPIGMAPHKTFGPEASKIHKNWARVERTYTSEWLDFVPSNLGDGYAVYDISGIPNPSDPPVATMLPVYSLLPSFNHSTAFCWSLKYRYDTGARFMSGTPLSSVTPLTRDPGEDPSDPADTGLHDEYIDSSWYDYLYQYKSLHRMEFEVMPMPHGPEPAGSDLLAAVIQPDPSGYPPSSAINQPTPLETGGGIDCGYYCVGPWYGEGYLCDNTSAGTVYPAFTDPLNLQEIQPKRVSVMPNRERKSLIVQAHGYHPIQPSAVSQQGATDPQTIVSYTRTPTVATTDYAAGNVNLDSFGGWFVWTHPDFVRFNRPSNSPGTAVALGNSTSFGRLKFRFKITVIWHTLKEPLWYGLNGNVTMAEPPPPIPTDRKGREAFAAWCRKYVAAQKCADAAEVAKLESYAEHNFPAQASYVKKRRLNEMIAAESSVDDLSTNVAKL